MIDADGSFIALALAVLLVRGLMYLLLAVGPLFVLGFVWKGQTGRAAISAAVYAGYVVLVWPHM